MAKISVHALSILKKRITEFLGINFGFQLLHVIESFYSLSKVCVRVNDKQWCRSCLSIRGIICNFTPILPYFQHWRGWTSTTILFRWGNLVKTKKKKQMEHFFPQSQVKTEKKGLQQEYNTFFPKFTFRCTPIQIIGGYIPPLFWHPWWQAIKALPCRRWTSARVRCVTYPFHCLRELDRQILRSGWVCIDWKLQNQSSAIRWWFGSASFHRIWPPARIK